MGIRDRHWKKAILFTVNDLSDFFEEVLYEYIEMEDLDVEEILDSYRRGRMRRVRDFVDGMLRYLERELTLFMDRQGIDELLVDIFGKGTYGIRYGDIKRFIEILERLVFGKKIDDAIMRLLEVYLKYL